MNNNKFTTPRRGRSGVLWKLNMIMAICIVGFLLFKQAGQLAKVTASTRSGGREDSDGKMTGAATQGGGIYDLVAPTEKRFIDYPKDVNILVVYSGPTSNDRNWTHAADTKNKHELYHRNLQYFLRNGGVRCENQDTIITLTRETVPVYQSEIQALNDSCRQSHNHTVTYMVREPKCYDLQSIFTVLQSPDVDFEKYDYFSYLNCGVSGPFGLNNTPWTHHFTSRLNNRVKMAGLSIRCQHELKGNHVQSFAYAVDRVGLSLIRNSNAIYQCRDDLPISEVFWEIVDRYEVGMSRLILEAGYEIASMIPNIVIDRFLSDRRCTTQDMWKISNLPQNFGGRMPSASETVFWKSSRFITTEVADLIRYPGGQINWLPKKNKTNYS